MRTRIGTTLALGAALLFGGTGLGCIQAPVTVEAVAIPGADLAGARTYALVAPPWDHPRVGATIEKEIPKQLDAKGLEAVPIDQADLAVSYRATGVRRQRSRTEAGTEVVYTVRESYIEGTVEIDVFDARTRDLMWRGVGMIDIAREPSAPAASAKAVRAILAELPVGSSAETEDAP